MVASIGEFFEAVGEWDEAAGCYQGALAVEPLVEDLYRRLMAVHLHCGQKAKALDVYYHCREVFARAQRRSLSAECEALHRAML
jgi:DNA-binding SARP family transcriptional activator